MAKPVRKEIQIRTTDGEKSIDALCLDGLAVHMQWDASDVWTVTHLASGMAALLGFGTERAAGKAMKELAGLRDWRLPITRGDLTGELTASVKSIAEKYGGHTATGNNSRGVELCPKGFNKAVLAPASDDGGA